MTKIILTGVLLLLLGATGCASSQRGPYAGQSEAARNPQRAQELTREAAGLIASDPIKAERLLREALGADLYHGPAHNNLGTIYLSRGELYEAASEFEWARKLMPGHPDPRLNLGIALERAGRVDAALEAYRTALGVYPNHLPTIQALTRCQLRFDRTDDQTAGWLDEIAMRGDERWGGWARQQAIALNAASGE